MQNLTAFAKQPPLPPVPEFNDHPKAAALVARLAEIGEKLLAARQRRQVLREEAAHQEPTRPNLLDTSRPLGGLAPCDPAIVEQQRQADRDVTALDEAARRGAEELRRIASRVGPEALKDVIRAHRAIVAALAETLIKAVALAAVEGDLLGSVEAAGWNAASVAPHGCCAPTGWLQTEYVKTVIREWMEAGILPAAEPWVTITKPEGVKPPHLSGRQDGRRESAAQASQAAQGKAKGKPAAVSA